LDFGGSRAELARQRAEELWSGEEIWVAVISAAIPEARGERRSIAPQAGFDAWWTLALTFLLSLVSYLDRSIVSMLVPEIKSTLLISDFKIGLILGPAFAVFNSLFGIPLGWASDRYSRRLVIFAGAIVFGVATIYSGFAASFVLLLLARTLVATGEASLGPAAQSLISEKFPRKLLNTALSIYSTGLKVGGAVALSIGAVAIVWAGQLIVTFPQLHGVAPWRLVFGITGVPAILLGLLVFTFKESSHLARAAATGEEGLTAMKFVVDERRFFVPMVIGFSLVAMCGQILISWTPTFFTREFGWKPAQYGPLLGAIGLASALTLVFKGALMDWFYARGIKDIHIRFYVWILLGSLPFVVAVFLVKSVWLFVALYAVVAIVTIPFLSYANVAVQIISPSHIRGRLAAFVAIPLGLAGGLGPMLVGGITDFAFKNESKIGLSMAIVFSTMIPGALASLYLCLKPLRAAVIAAEARDAAALADHS
jgi:MFS family permease